MVWPEYGNFTFTNDFTFHITVTPRCRYR